MAASANYDGTVAEYRQTTLMAFQQVEDYLAAVRILSQEVPKQKQAVHFAETSLTLELGRYETGIDPYLDVVVAQMTLLANQQVLVTTQVSEMVAAVQAQDEMDFGEADELAEAQRDRDTPDQLGEPAFQPLNASVHFDRVLFDGGEFGTAAAAGSPEEEDFLGLPGLLEPDQVRTLLSKRQQSQLAARSRGTGAAPPAPAALPVTRQQLATLRKELNGLVGAWSHRTGQPHGVIHAELRQACGGPPLPQASADQIQARIATLRRWAVSGR